MNYLQIEQIGEQVKKQHEKVMLLWTKYLKSPDGTPEGTKILQARSNAVDQMRSIDAQYIRAVRSFCFIS